MLIDALRGYLQLANGLTDVTRQRALAAAKALLDQSGDVVGGAVGSPVAKQAQSLAEDLMATSRNNRDLLLGLIHTEVDRAVARVGLVSADELAAMARKVERLERQLDAAIAFAGTAEDVERAAGAPVAAATKAPAKKAPAKKAPAKKAPAKKAAARRVPTKKAAAGPAPSAPAGPSAEQA